jgi:uncharacterized protein YndB with AHSA1/START domain
MEKITVQTSVHADLNTVWDLWTKPEHITQWNFASDEWCCPIAENDLRPNGKFRSRMEAKDGSMGFDFEGIYSQVVEQQLISYGLADGRQVDIEFEQDGDTVVVTETFDPEEINITELQRAGWQAILDNFKKYVESK